MNCIKGYCRTNLDNYDCSDVRVFVAVPRIGESVRVSYKGNATWLKVCMVTHTVKNNEPEIIVELHN